MIYFIRFIEHYMSSLVGCTKLTEEPSANTPLPSEMIRRSCSAMVLVPEFLCFLLLLKTACEALNIYNKRITYKSDATLNVKGVANGCTCTKFVLVCVKLKFCKMEAPLDSVNGWSNGCKISTVSPNLFRKIINAQNTKWSVKLHACSLIIHLVYRILIYIINTCIHQAVQLPTGSEHC